MSFLDLLEKLFLCSNFSKATFQTRMESSVCIPRLVIELHTLYYREKLWDVEVTSPPLGSVSLNVSEAVGLHDCRCCFCLFITGLDEKNVFWFLCWALLVKTALSVLKTSFPAFKWLFLKNIYWLHLVLVAAGRLLSCSM